MRRTVASLAALAILLGWGGINLAQKGADEKKNPRQQGGKGKKPAAPSLDDLLAEALKNNPDIQVAQAKLHEADAQLNRARLQVMQRMVAYHHNLASQKAQVAAAEDDFRRMSELAKKGVITENLVRTAAANLTAAKAKLAEIEAELPYLLGKQPMKSDAATRVRQLQYLQALSQAHSAWYQEEAEKRAVARGLLWLARVQNAESSLRGTAADKIRKALDTPVTLQIREIALDQVFTHLEDRVPNITFRVVADVKRDIKGLRIELVFKQPIPLGAVLQAIQDSVPNLNFAVREYGLLVTSSDQLPPDAVLVQDFWKGGTGKKSGGSGDSTSGNVKRNPPPNQVDGRVTQVSADTGLVEINIGSDAGLVKGHTLEAFRLRPNPLYLGTVAIIDVTPNRAVARPLSPNLKGKIKVGDRVASQINR